MHRGTVVMAPEHVFDAADPADAARSRMGVPAQPMLTLPVIDPAARAAGLATLKANRAEAEALLAPVPSWTPETAIAVGTILIEALKTHDALQAERDRVVMPIHAAYKN